MIPIVLLTGNRFGMISNQAQEFIAKTGRIPFGALDDADGMNRFDWLEGQGCHSAGFFLILIFKACEKGQSVAASQ